MLLQEPYRRNNYKSLSHSNTFFISALSQRQTAKWCRHESSPRIVLAHRANGWQRSTHRGGKQFQIVGMQNWSKKKYIYICIRCCGVLLSFLLFTLLHPSNAKRRGPCTTSLTASHRTNRSFACKPAPAAVTQEGRYLKVFSKELEMYFLFILFRWRIGFGSVVDCMNRNLNMDGRWQNYIDHTWLYLVLTQCIHN